MVSKLSLSCNASIEQFKSIPYTAMRRLMRELKELRTSPPEGIRVQLSEESVLDLIGIVEGPGESP
jgi:ubiquitin-conjugating enzyme E2 S